MGQHITRCPDCKSEVEYREWTEEPVGLVEVFTQCVNKCFTFSWSYGSTEFHCKDGEWYWGHEEEPPEAAKANLLRFNI
jgi:hypothetical protein